MKKQKSKEELILENRLKSKIQELFWGFKVFIDKPELELCEVEVFNGLLSRERGATTSTVIYPQNPKQKLRFRTERFNAEVYGKGIKAHYYHEFTHIYDYYNMMKLFDINELASYTRLYSEFHASEIEMKIAMGFSNAFVSKNVSLAEEISIGPNDINLGEYIKNETSSYHREIPVRFKEYSENSTPSSLANLLHKLVNHSMYYYSKVHFLEKYCIDDFSDKVDMSIFPDILGEDIKHIFELLKTDTIDKSILVSLKEYGSKISDNFFEKYKSD